MGTVDAELLKPEHEFYVCCNLKHLPKSQHLPGRALPRLYYNTLFNLTHESQ